MTVVDLSGFPVKAVDLPVPPFPVSADVQDALVNMLVAVRANARPEEVAGFLADGYPDWVAEALDRPHERAELDAFVNVLLYVMQTPGNGG